MQLPDIRTVDDLIRLAAALEQRAAARFRGLAERMRMDGREDLSALFERLAGDEDAHLKTLLAAAAGKAIDMKPEETVPLDALGEGSALPDAAELARATVYECLAEAVRNEEKAFAFFSYVAAHAEDNVLKAEAEALAKEELAHAALLRQARREAYRDLPDRPARWPHASEIQTLQDLARAVIVGETAIAGVLTDYGDRWSSAAALSAAALDMAAKIQGLAEVPAAADGEQNGARIPASALQQAVLDEAENAFAFYDAVVAAATREDVLLQAQELSAHALERLRALQESP